LPMFLGPLLVRAAMAGEATGPPNVVDAYCLSETQVRVLYDRPMDPTTTTNVANYSLGSLTQIDAVVMDGNSAVVLIMTSGPGAGHGVPESVVVSGVKDALGFPMSSPQSRNFVMGVLSAADVQAPAPDSLAATPCVDRSAYAGLGASPGISVSVTGV